MVFEMDGRELLAATDIDPTGIDDADILDLLEPAVREWWVDQYGDFIETNDGLFTPPQRDAIPLIHDKNNTLICSPTGSGKTHSCFLAIINELYRRSRETGLENTVYCLYISPLKSLANDIHRNLEIPLNGILNTSDQDESSVPQIRHAIRHGDTSKTTRSRMLDETPHLLNTTPETLAILLNSPRFREKLASVEYVIVDEIHSIASNKRGTHLALSLERLENLVHESPTRIGCSATIEPIETIADFLVGREHGEPRPCEIVDTRFVRDFDLRLDCPTHDLIHTDYTTVQDRFYERVHRYITDHDTTLVFTNTRSGAERVLFNLRDRYPHHYTEENSGCHHGSLSQPVRESVEERLKTGEITVVTTSTSLELGVDMPTLDLVIQVGSPKSVAALLQRVGRAGHQPGDTVKGRVIALDRDELIECTVMVQKAVNGFVDRVHVPTNCQDVAAQHVYGMAINHILPEQTVWETIKRAYPYQGYTRADFETLLRYLTADYDGLDARNVYAKIWRDTNDPPDGAHHHPSFSVGQPLIGKRGRLARPIYLQNVGTIPDSFTCNVFTRSENEWVGELDEGYLDTIDPGDVFLLGGDHYTYRYRRGSNVYTDPTDDRPTVPSWFSERLPLSVDLGREILVFESAIRTRFSRDGEPAVRSWLREFPIDENTVYAVTQMFAAQIEYVGSDRVPGTNRIVIEEVRDLQEFTRRFFVHSYYGRRFNDGLSRIVAHKCAQETATNVTVAVADQGFSLSMPLNRKVSIPAVLADIAPDDVRDLLRDSLAETDLLQRYFRINATRALMILKRYKGTEKSARKQQVSSEMLLGFAQELDDFAVIEETYRELLEDKLSVSAIESVMSRIKEGDIEIAHTELEYPSPLAFGLATLASSDVVLAEDESAVLRSFHQRVMRAIESGRTDGTDL